MNGDASWVGSMPESYDRCLGPALFAPWAIHLSELAAALSPQRVLELAAGTGVATAELVRRLPDADVTATDLNAGMVSWGRQRVAGASWQQADAQELPFAESSLDLVVCQFGVMFFPDRPGAFAEIARVLRPGGTVLFTSWDVVAKSDFTNALVASVTALLPDDPPTFVVRVPHGYTDPAQISADLAAGGLESISIDHVVLRSRSPSARLVAQGFCLGTPLRFALGERGDLDAMTAAVADAMTTRLGAGPVDGQMAAYVVSARAP